MQPSIKFCCIYAILSLPIADSFYSQHLSSFPSAPIKRLSVLHRTIGRPFVGTSQNLQNVLDRTKSKCALDATAEKDMKSSILGDITELTGNTPMVRLNKVTKSCLAEIAVKLEVMQPTMSIKDRIALGMITAAEDRGEIFPGRTTLIEPTSGNTGIALAMVASVKGYQLIITMPETMSLERRVLLMALGAKLVLTPAALGMQGAIDKATALAASMGADAFILSQFSNRDNAEVHYRTTGPEIWRQTGGAVDVLVAGVGTGGTIAGAARFLRERNPALRVVAVEPSESPVLSGGPPGPHRIQGIGAEFVPPIYDPALVDEVLAVSSADAMAMARRLAREEGLLCGVSTGAAVAAAVRVGEREGMRGRRVVTFAASSGERYLSTPLFAADLAVARAQLPE